MSGYTPVFRTIFEGSLCGKYPDTAAWLFLLALADKDGCVDKTPQYISAVTGMPVEDLMGCIERFMQPDPASRSPADDGRRLVAIDPARGWGWQVVNHGKYREKARKMSYDSDRTASGRDAERKRDERNASRAVPTRPDASRAVPLSDTDTDSDTGTPSSEEGVQGESPRKRADRATRIPDDFSLTPERRIVAEAEKLPADRTFAKFRDYWAAASGQRARKHDWDATWRTWCLTEADRSRGNGAGAAGPMGRKTRYDQSREALKRAAGGIDLDDRRDF